MEQLDKTLAEVISKSSEAIQNAAKEYGPDAVDLGLWVYRIEAAQILIWGFVFSVAFLASHIFYWKKMHPIIAAKNDHDGFEYFFGGLFTFLSLMLLLGASNVLNIYAWAAVFGKPEVFIAYKALVAAGLI